MVSKIKDKTVLITGGSRGIGFACAQELLRNNAKSIAILSVSRANGQEALAKLEKEFGKNRAIFVQCDVTDSKQLLHAYQEVMKQFQQIDIVINNAGILNDRQWEYMINLNVTGMIASTLLAIDLMGTHKGGKGGTIINVSSIAGVEPFDAIPTYTSTKFAVQGFTRSLEGIINTTGIRTLTMCPGGTSTDLLTDKSERYLNFIDYDYAVHKLATLPMQTSEQFAKGMMKLIEKGESGQLAVCENQETYTINIPDYHTLPKHIL